jgi:hypothetical protein
MLLAPFTGQIGANRRGAEALQYQHKNGTIYDGIQIPRGPWASRFCGPQKIDSRNSAA